MVVGGVVAKKRKFKMVYRQVEETPDSQARIESFYDFIFERAYGRWKKSKNSQTFDSSEQA